MCQRKLPVTGVRYEGEWRDGREHGAGTLVETDGSTFYGFWADGCRHGEGVRYIRHQQLPEANIEAPRLHMCWVPHTC